MLRCADGSYYVGQTTDIERRLAEHQTGVYEGYTSSRRPVELVWHEHIQTDDEAFKLERKLKGWSRAKKEALIKSDFAQLHGIVRDERKRREAKKRSNQTEAS
jgi:predicted GIY-YIG superfamily endonuclease